MNKERIAVVTGATGKIGSAIANKLIGDGYTVFAIGRDEKKGQELEKLLHGKTYRFCCLDVKNEVEVRQFFEQHRNELMSIELLVTCAGILELGNFEKSKIDLWQGVIDTNLYGTLYFVYHALPLMKKNGKGLIVAIGSRWGESGATKAAAYSASKSALRAFIKSLQLECVGTGVRPILLSPGSVAGGMSNQVDAYIKDKLLSPADVAQMVSFIASSPDNVIFDEISMKAFAHDLTHL